MTSITPTPTVTDAEVERVALAMGAALKRDCISRDGTCYAVADSQIAYDGDIVAEVDGEISLLSLARAAIAAMTRSDDGLRSALADRDEWKQQHENLLGVKEADNAALTASRDKWMLLAQRALAYLPSTLGIARDIREAIDSGEIERALARIEERGVATLTKGIDHAEG